MHQLIFATNNANKVKEVQAIVPPWLSVVSLNDAGITIEIEEPHDSFEENALEKVKAISAITNQPCFAEDSGLVVPALGGEPGVRSARYASAQATSAENMQKLLTKIQGTTDRAAYFVTVIALQWNNEMHFFRGECHGSINLTAAGSNGFGYDPLFIPTGHAKTFGEMSAAEKHALSHRAKAMNQLIAFLSKLVP